MAFTADGFSLTNPTAANDELNFGSRTYASWNWKANGAGVANTAGTISSTVSANTTSGFSVVSWTGNGTSGATVGHGLGVTPKMFIVKNRTVAGAWLIQHAGLTGQPQANSSTITLGSGNTDGMLLFSNGSVISYGFDGQMNGSGNSMIAYCFAEIKGFSKFGFYTGTTGAYPNTPFIYTGFKPAFVMIKKSGGVANWVIYDNKRPAYNSSPNQLSPSTTGTESSTVDYYGLDLLSNGFKIANTSAYGNEYNGTERHIYMAFAEQPLVGTNNVPCTAR
jgi:hypothetical protein